MTNKVITISRMFGSGGRTIGKAVAQRLGIPYYDKELVDAVAKDKLYVCQTNVIRDLADKGPCVIVGRCADYILKDRPDCLHIFIHADMEHRAARVRERYGETSKPMEKRLQEKDSKRKIYYKHYTNRNWGEAQNYHLCLNSGLIGVDKCTDIICDVAEMV